MNEFKIIISAVNSAAKKAVREVKDEIEKTSQSAKKNGKSISDSMKSIAKGAAIAVGAIAAVSTALVAFGKSTIEAQKNISKLNAAFQAAGSTSEQAGETYKNLYRFMGDSGAATEAAQQLALITTNEKDLVEWTKILQGVYATMGSTLPIESLAEAANETIKVGQVTGTMADALNWAGISEDAFNAKLAQTTSLSEREALVRSTLNNLYMNAANIYERNNAALLANAESQARLDLALAQAGQTILPLMTAFNNLAATLLSVLRPAFEIVASVIAVFVEYIIIAVSWVSAFFSLFTGGGSKARNTSKDISNSFKNTTKNVKGLSAGVGGLGSGLNKAASAAKELKRQTMGFDELNVMQSQPTSSGAGGAGGAGGGGGGIPLPDLSGITDIELPTLDDFTRNLEETREKIKAILILLGSIGAAIALFELIEWFPTIKDAIKNFDLMSSKLRFALGYILIIVGAIAAAAGYSDAWVNGIDWGNFALTLGGLAVLIAGVGLAFGGIYAGIVAVGAGIALIVLGYKDLITNGSTLQNNLTMLVGLLAILAGAWYAYTLPIALVVTGLAAVVLGTASFINQGPTLQNTILIIGGAIAIAVGLATAGLSVVLSAIIAAGVALAAFVTAIALEEKAIKDVKTAQENYKKAIDASVAAHDKYKSAIDTAKSAQEKLAEAEKKAGASGKELYEGVMNGKIAFDDMTDAQKEAYWAYLDNEKAQQDLKAATDEMKAAMDAEKKAFWENKLAVDAEAGAYDEFKQSVVDAYESGALSAEEARDLIGASMSEMSRDTQKTFMEDLPNDIKNGLDPKQYETTAQKLSKWFEETKTKCVDKWNDFKDKMGNKFNEAKDKAKEKFDGIKEKVNTIKNETLAKFNSFPEDMKQKFNEAKQKAIDKFSEITSEENLGRVKNKIVSLFGDIGSKAGAAIGGAVKSAINGAISLIESRINSGINLINGAINLINKLPGVSVGKLSRLSLPRLAKGGIVDSATIAMIGEAGKEAVIPLENNTQWMDSLAEKLAARSQTPTKVILKVGEKELGWATIGAINGITEQTGGLQLVL